MIRTLTTTSVVAGLVCALVPSVASARIVEIGRVADAAAPSCPARPCFAISRTTGYQAKIGTERGLYTVPANGKIVAWTIRLGNPGKKQRAFFEETFGGPAQAGITVMRPGRKLYSRVVTKSPLYQLTPYFGQTVQFPLGRALNVKKGYLVALTVPTWAPALVVGLGKDTSWRAARDKDHCDDVQTQTSQTELTGIAQYRCLYKTARLTYSATLITRPTPSSKAPSDDSADADTGTGSPTQP